MNIDETQPEVIEATVADVADNQEQEETTLEATIVPEPILTRKEKNQYFGKLRLLGTIHAELADKLNEKRYATYEAFFMPDDKYIPETKEKDLLVRLALGKVNAMPSEPEA
jgi:hypothetical protein